MIIESITILGLNCTTCHCGKEYVDLGLESGTLWATMNIGANSPEETGLYFAWGEISGFTEQQVTSSARIFDINHYLLYDANRGYTRYNDSDKMVLLTRDTDNQYGLIDDAARVNWGCEWCMPTIEQIVELNKSTTQRVETLNGVSGMTFQSTENGNSIFLPFGGVAKDNYVIGKDEYGHYWSNERNSNDLTNGSGYDIENSGDVYPKRVFERSNGLLIRPVLVIEKMIK